MVSCDRSRVWARVKPAPCTVTAGHAVRGAGRSGQVRPGLCRDRHSRPETHPVPYARPWTRAIAAAHAPYARELYPDDGTLADAHPLVLPHRRGGGPDSWRLWWVSSTASRASADSGGPAIGICPSSSARHSLFDPNAGVRPTATDRSFAGRSRHADAGRAMGNLAARGSADSHGCANDASRRGYRRSADVSRCYVVYTSGLAERFRCAHADRGFDEPDAGPDADRRRHTNRRGLADRHRRV